MSKPTSKQMRVSDAQYKILSKLSEDLGISRVEILSNSIGLINKLVENNATSVKVVCGDGTEKELLITLLMGFVDAG